MNDIVIAFLTVFFGFCIFILCRAITVITHEIGHAIPALLFTLKPVNIYIGSYGQDKGMMKLSLRKNLTLNIKNNPLTWQSGMVEHFPENISFTKKFLITILGPLMSLIIALVGLWLCFNFDLHGFLKLFTIIFCLSALFDLRNIYPSDEPILLNDGSAVYCDGYKLKLLLQERKQNAIFKKGLKLLDENKNDSAYALFKTIPTNKFNYLTSTVIVDFFGTGQFSTAKEFCDKLISQSFFHPDSFALCNFGVVESNLHHHEVALGYYQRSIEQEADNPYAFANRGFTYNLLGRYHEAITDFSNVIESDAYPDYAYANRGYAKIKLNKIEEGLADIDTALAIDSNCAYAYRNLGIYYLDNNNYTEALKQFNMARKINANVYMLDEYITIAKSDRSKTAI